MQILGDSSLQRVASVARLVPVRLGSGSTGRTIDLSAGCLADPRSRQVESVPRHQHNMVPLLAGKVGHAVTTTHAC